MGNCINACSVALHIEAPARVSIKLFKACESGDYDAVFNLFYPPKEPSEEDLKEQHITDPKKWQRPHPAKADVTDLDGAQPIHVAAQFGHVDIIEFLIDHGADPQARDKSGWTPAHSACSGNHMEALKFLLDETGGQAANARTDDGVSLLHVLAQQGHLELLEFLCYAKFERTNLQLLTKDVFGYYAFMHAAENRHLGCLQFLLDHIELNTDRRIKSIINSRAASGGTCLLFACANGDDAMVEYLLRSGAYPDARTKSGASCIHIIAEKGHISTLKILLNTLSRQDKLTIQEKKKLKRARGAASEAKDGEKAVDIVITDDMQLDDEHQELFGAVDLFPQAKYHDRKQHHVSLNVRTEDGYTPLMFAVVAKKIDMIKFLVEEMMVDINARTTSLESALFFAKKRLKNNREMIELLGGEWVEPTAAQLNEEPAPEDNFLLSEKCASNRDVFGKTEEKEDDDENHHDHDHDDEEKSEEKAKPADDTKEGEKKEEVTDKKEEEVEEQKPSVAKEDENDKTDDTQEKPSANTTDEKEPIAE